MTNTNTTITLIPSLKKAGAILTRDFGEWKIIVPWTGFSDVCEILKGIGLAETLSPVAFYNDETPSYLLETRVFTVHEYAIAVLKS